MTALRRLTTNLVFSFNTQNGVNYVLQSAANMVTPVPWVNVQTNAGNGGAQSFTNVINPLQPQIFFRVRAY